MIKTKRWPIVTERNMVQVRQFVRAWSVELGFRLVDLMKLITAASDWHVIR